MISPLLIINTWIAYSAMQKRSEDLATYKPSNEPILTNTELAAKGNTEAFYAIFGLVVITLIIFGIIWW